MTLTNLKQRLRAVNRVVKVDSYREWVDKYRLIQRLNRLADKRRSKLMQDRIEGATMMTEQLTASIDRLLLVYEAKKRKPRGNNTVT